MNITRSYFGLFLVATFSICISTNAQEKEAAQTRSSDTGPSWGDPEGLVVGFSSKRSGDYDIYIRHLGSQQTLRIIEDPADQHYPVFSPDGGRIAYQNQIGDNMELYLFDVTSGRKTNLSNHPSSDGNDYSSWAKDGKSIFFTSNRNGNRDIFRKTIGGSEAERVTPWDSNELNPSISPNGELIAFSSDKGGNFDIYVMNLDGSNLRQVTKNESNEMFPSWHPDGKSLVFQRRTEFRQSDIFSVSLEGTDEKNLTNSKGLKFYPRMSADGSRILYMSGSEEGTFIYVLNLSDGAVKRVSGQ